MIVHNRASFPLASVGAQTPSTAEDNEAYRQKQQCNAAIPAFIAHGFNRTAIQPGQDKQNGNSCSHSHQSPEFRIKTKQRIGNRAQHGIERSEIPDRSNMLGSFQIIPLL